MKYLSTLVLFFSLIANQSFAFENDVTFKEGELIIKFKSDSSGDVQDVFKTLSDKIGFMHLKDKLEVDKSLEVIHSYEWAKIHHVKLLPYDDIETMISEIQQMDDVEYVEPNYYLSLGATLEAFELETSAGQSESAAGMGPLEAAAGAQEVVVAIIDTGLDYDHQDIKDHVWTNTAEIAGNGIDDDNNGYVDDTMGWDFVNNDPDPYDDHYHGTHVAGITLGLQNPSDGIIKIMPLKFLSAGGFGSTGDAIKAIDYAVKNGAKVINNSWGGGSFSFALRDAIAASYNANTVFVVAAGNSSLNIDSSPVYPPSYLVPNEITVAALDAGENLSWFSNYGPQGVHVGAPGSSIYSTLPKERCAEPPCYGYLSGTSMAAPYVSGVAAMMLSENPDLQHLQVKQIIMETSVSNASIAGLIGQGSVSASDAYTIAAATTPDTEIPVYVPNSIPASIGLTAGGPVPMGCAAAFISGNGQGPKGGFSGPLTVISWPLLFMLLFLRAFYRRKFAFN